ncbi:1-phosphofructokinase family hexose kinase [Tetragenococcus solitarius]|uniref:Tagatose-6-phosphate kinase n=1 Tax=Tetragenococcus solitarius TaxID=71453 RepID=A0ABP6KJV5_9ENTE|nr:PfkB family carbohydrate kinase [Tetragenococcus solitarius]
MIHLICPNPAIDRTVLLESIQFGSPNRPIRIEEFPGGKSFNVAYALAHTVDSEKIMIHTMLGGIYGKYVTKLAKKYGYFIQATQVEKNTRICTIIVDISKKTVLPIYEKGFELSNTTLQTFTDSLLDSIVKNDILVFSGSLMKGMPSDYIAKISQQLQGKNIRLCIDTSGDSLKETYRTTSPYLIKINDEEAQDLFPNKNLHTQKDFLYLLDKDIKTENFVITLGAKGIVGKINGRLYEGYAQPIETKNPIASGDFFLGRMIAGIEKQTKTVDMLKDALCYSTCNAMNWFPTVESKQLAKVRATITVNEITV